MKVFKSVVLFCLFVTLFILFSACTPEVTPVPSSEGLAYEVNEDGKTATITGIGTCTATEIVIGTEIEGYTVTAIASHAFARNSKIVSVELAETVVSIGAYAFDYCAKLEHISIPSTLQELGTEAISIRNEKFVTRYEGGYYVGNDHNPYLIFLQVINDNHTTIVVHEDTKFIASHAMALPHRTTKLEAVVLPEGLISIGNAAFEGLDYLSSIAIPDSVTTLGNNAFANCTALCSITLGKGLKEISVDAFQRCHSLTTIIVSEENPVYHSAGNCLIETESKTLVTGGNQCVIPTDGSVTSIADKAFSARKNLTSISIPDSVTKIGDWAFLLCSSLTQVTLGDGLTEIASSAFSNCSALSTLTGGENVSKIGASAFASCSSLTTLPFGSKVTEIGHSAFWYCESLEEARFGDQLTKIGKSAFAGCKSLTKLTLGSYMTEIGENIIHQCLSLTYNQYDNGFYLGGNENPYLIFVKAASTDITSCQIHPDTTLILPCAFENCTLLTDISIGGKITAIPAYAFSGCTSLVDLEIGDSVTEIGDFAFYHCESLKSFRISQYVTKLGARFLNGNVAMEVIYVHADNPVYHSYRNCLVETATKTLVAGCQKSQLPYDNSITEIGPYAFGECTSLTTFDWAYYDVKKIGVGAFYGCEGLTYIALSASMKLGQDVFDNCINLTTIRFGGTVRQWLDAAWNGWYENCPAVIECKDAKIIPN